MMHFTLYAADDGSIFVEDISAPTREDAEQAAFERLCEAFGYEAAEWDNLDDLPCYALQLDEWEAGDSVRHLRNAAPDMLLLLQEAMELMPLGTAKRAVWMDKAAVAIAKARGEG